MGAGEEGKEIVRVGKRDFVCFAWFSLLFLVTLFCNREWVNTMTGIFAAELSLILQRLILLYRPLRFSDGISMIDCNFDNTWRLIGVKLIDKVARILFHSLLLFLLL